MSFASATVEAAPAARPAIRIHGHLPPLDGLRGIAILSVITFHMGNSLWINWGLGNQYTELVWGFGWAGVDLFFVLSGFLITGILYDSKGTAAYFRNFYARRTLRIFPLYYLGILAFLALGAVPLLNVEGNVSPWWVVAYLTNVITAAGESNSVGWLGHYWSLAVEEHYYLIWPTFVFLLDRRALIKVAVAAILLAPLLRVMQTTFHVLPSAEAVYVLTPMRVDSLAAGSLLALLVRGPSGAAPYLKPAYILAGASGAAICTLILVTRNVEAFSPAMSTIGLSLNAAFFASILLVALSWKPAYTAASNGVLRWFGKYSYGLYVWHPLAFMTFFHSQLTQPLRGDGSPGNILLTTALAIGATVGAALLSWHLMEKQFLKLKVRFHPEKPAAETPPDVQGLAARRA